MYMQSYELGFYYLHFYRPRNRGIRRFKNLLNLLSGRVQLQIQVFIFLKKQSAKQIYNPDPIFREELLSAIHLEWLMLQIVGNPVNSLNTRHSLSRFTRSQVQGDPGSLRGCTMPSETQVPSIFLLCHYGSKVPGELPDDCYSWGCLPIATSRARRGKGGRSSHTCLLQEGKSFPEDSESSFAAYLARV